MEKKRENAVKSDGRRKLNYPTKECIEPFARNGIIVGHTFTPVPVLPLHFIVAVAAAAAAVVVVFVHSFALGLIS